jgi:mRNA interferase MazF
VVADLTGDDIVVCQKTSKSKSDPLALPLGTYDFISGSLPVDSFIRPNAIFLNTLRFLSGLSLRARHLSSLKLTPSVQCKLFSIDQWLRIIRPNSLAGVSLLLM